MSTDPRFSLRILVAVVAAGTVLGSKAGMRYLWSGTPTLRSLVAACYRQLRADVRTGTRWQQWLVVITWGVTLVALHYFWLAHHAYSTISWLDILAHWMGGIGVAGIILVGLREEIPPTISGWWVVFLVLAIGASFELYEFLIKTFWYDWSFLTYLDDTLLDLFIDAAGGAIVVAAATAAATIPASTSEDA